MTPRERLISAANSHYDPVELAESLLALLEFLECASNTKPGCDRYRSRTGLICAPEFRGYKKVGDVENAITDWLATFYPNASSQVTDYVPGSRPDIVFSFQDPGSDNGILVLLEAKPVWQRWFTTGEIEYAGVNTDEYGRSTGSYADNNILQVIGDREKLLCRYTHPNDRHMLLALVFQRPGELDSQIVDAVGPGLSHRKRHVLDRCNPPGDDIGVTGMVFWPDRGA